MNTNLFRNSAVSFITALLLLPHMNAQNAESLGQGMSGAAKDSVTLVTAKWNWEKLGRGAEVGQAQVELFGAAQCITMVRYQTRRFRTGIVNAPKERSAGTDILGERSKFTAAINGSYFNMKELTPVTFICIDGEIMGRTSASELFRTDGVVAIKGKRGKEIEIFKCDTTKYAQYAQEYNAAIASGPLLVSDGQIPNFATGSFFGNRHPRTAIGISADGKTVFLIVADGRSAENAEGLTIPELAQTVKWLGSNDALNLDGGGSTALWTKREGILNCPSDNGKFDHGGCRKVPNIIGIK